MNRLKNEKSPYLLQHADNPVDWYPWGPEAFEKARQEDKPIFLSIGYSTCHWCHVMEHESFENEEVARLMNQTFVSIKVDREERPDLDQLYMTVAQLMTGGGGWPLNIFMTPDKKPFFAATYIPKDNLYGRLGMMELIPRVDELWRTNRQELLSSADRIVAALRQVSESQGSNLLDASVLDKAYQQLLDSFDRDLGGFGNAPKFPTPHNFYFLLRYWQRSGREEALDMVEKTLQAMRAGGIYDHVGFGFHRYSTDAEWLVPHFEKMLYDQALLTLAYTEVFQATGKSFYQTTAREILSYILRDMQSPEGAFYSAEDADSEGEEGKFYLWNYGELENLLNDRELDQLVRNFGLKPEGNFTDQDGGSSGLNILHGRRPANEAQEDFQAIRKKLFAYRQKRIHPLKDDKILTSWNGLMIAALARAGGAFSEKAYTDAAEKAASFIMNQMRDGRGRLLHRFRLGEAGIQAFSEDYAFFIWGLIELYEATADIRYLKSALELNRDFIENYWDDEQGGFYMTADDVGAVLLRQRSIGDGALPAASSVALLNLLRLARFTDNSEYWTFAETIIRRFSDHAERNPRAHTFFLGALDFQLGPGYEIVIAGQTGSRDTEAMLRAVRRRFLPNKILLHRPSEKIEPEILDLADFLRYQEAIDGRATAYICQNYACRLPTNDLESLVDQLENGLKQESLNSP